MINDPTIPPMMIENAINAITRASEEYLTAHYVSNSRVKWLVKNDRNEEAFEEMKEQEQALEQTLHYIHESIKSLEKNYREIYPPSDTR